jgi:DNA repair photolyase
LNRDGIPTGVLIAPLMPGINDAPHQVEPLLEAAENAGATSIGGVALHLRGEVRDVFMGWLEAKRPELVPRYRELYKRGANASPQERRRLARIVRRGDGPSAFRTHGHAPRDEPTPERASVTAQESLF